MWLIGSERGRAGRIHECEEREKVFKPDFSHQEHNFELCLIELFSIKQVLMMYYGNRQSNPALTAVAIFAAILFSMFRYSFTSPPDDLWFQVRVVESQKPVIVKFGADWCGPCRAMDSELAQLRSRYSGKINVVEIDIDEKPHLADHYGVSSIPRIFLFNNGRIKKSRTGYASHKELLSWSKSYLD